MSSHTLDALVRSHYFHLIWSFLVGIWCLLIRLNFSYHKGDDDYGKKLVEKATESGVNMKPQINKENPTGTCGVLITGADRSLVANLAAANHFNRSHFDDESVKTIIDKADYFYIGVSWK